jgi:hypothetical protein
MLKFRVNMKLGLSLIAFLQICPVFSQTHLPGGVRGALVWEVTEPAQSGQAQWKSVLTHPADTGFLVRGKIKTINNYPAVLFSNVTDTAYGTINLGKLEAFSLFTVCQESDTVTERVVFSLGSDTAAEMVLTNRRMAALDIYHYTNYKSDILTYPKIYSYTQNKIPESGTASQNLQFGRPPRHQNLPVSHYNGIMAEVILFPRVISPGERQRVESYLALKYGITLNQKYPASYLNSSGEVIWDAEVNAAYNKNIAGLGRDDRSGFNQKVSESTQNPGVMKVSVPGELRNNSFLIWGDNGRALRFDEDSGIRRMLREWRLSAFNYEGGPVNVAINELLFHDINPLLPGETYWMMTDRSGTGKFPFRETDYFRSLPPSHPERIIRFDSVTIDTDFSGSDLFTIIAAPSFFARSIVVPPKCASPHTGAIQSEIAGGAPPFNVLLKGTTNNIIKAFANVTSRYHLLEGISQGAYLLQITDAEGKIFTEEIMVSNLSLWENTLAQSYTLPEGETLVLNAADGMPSGNYLHSWTLPDGSLFNREEIKIDVPGKYLLSVTDADNCISTTEVKVKQTDRSGLRDMELFPNPVNGWFALRISLEWEMDINVIISDMSGKTIKQTHLRNDRYYLYNDIIKEPGTYMITIVTDMHRETLKLIVQ